ncbi:hypothetical protein [Bifidobacterium phasiani]|uniref:Uncharacterized protein n=1 Tax=Bifidobacterium phasiani TaxID=2834431 RepID=A0ABS6WB59_9BIFI|nr:hypothetical protein [Bifidobacterium phasiani]MBW3083753.1 hypothetical protein [Bifidobacterium phasiani]
MKKATGRLNMSMQARHDLEGRTINRLMDVQDNDRRGDGDSVQRIMTTFQMDADLKADLKQYCSGTGMKMGEAINQAVSEWLRHRQ